MGKTRASMAWTCLRWTSTIAIGIALSRSRVPPALWLGFRQIRGTSEGNAEPISHRGEGYADPYARHSTSLGLGALERLADADAFGSMGLDRHRALWAVLGLEEKPLPLLATVEHAPAKESEVALPAMTIGEQVVADCAAFRLSLKAHPLSLLHERLSGHGVIPAVSLAELPDGQRIAVASLVLVRQRPGSANGAIFAILEDETGAPVP